MKCDVCDEEIRVPANCVGAICRDCNREITVPIRIQPSTSMFLKAEWISAQVDGGREITMANIVNAPAVWLKIDGRSYVADLKPLLEALLEADQST